MSVNTLLFPRTFYRDWRCVYLSSLNNVIEIPTIKHYLYIDKFKYKEQPQSDGMRDVTNRAKYKGKAERLTIVDLLKAAKSGQMIVPCNYELDTDDKIRFISSTLLMLDVDDEKMVTDPIQVLNKLKNICTGLFYTFSHGLEGKGNRYRLLFQLDKPVRNLQDYSALLSYLANHIKQYGIPVDTTIKTPTIPVRTGRKGYVINSLHTTISVDEWLPMAKKQFSDELNTLRQSIESDFEELMKSPPTYEELKEICETIGHIPTGMGAENTEKWLSATYGLKHCCELGIITDSEGLELFNIVSGNEASEKQWYSKKASGRANFYTLLKLASGKGYQRKRNYKQSFKSNVNEGIPTERMNTDRVKNDKGQFEYYIPTNKAVEILQREERLLIKSPTGSGKTTAFMTAFKQLANESHNYYIFSVPTRVLGEQIAKEHGIEYIKGGMTRKKEKVITDIRHGKRIFVSTFDKTKELITYIKTYHTGINVKIHLVIDEAHKIIEAYNYRYEVLNELKELSKTVSSYTGLTGTPEDCLKSDYDKMVIFKGKDESPCQTYSVVQYEAIDGLGVKESGNQLLIKFIQRQVTEKMRLLVFINDIKRAEVIRDELQKNNIKTEVIHSKNKESSTYKQIIDNGTVKDDIQVILSTSVLADGVSINNDLNWLCVVVSDHESQFNNPSTIKQISNRFRNDYRYFVLFTRPPKEENQDETSFNMAVSYLSRLNIAKNYVDYLTEEHEKSGFVRFIPTTIEKDYGIYLNQESSKIEFNNLQLRHHAMKSKELYYMQYRNALIKEVGRLIGHNKPQILRYSETDDIFTDSEITEIVKSNNEKKLSDKLERSQKLQNFNEYFDENVYLAITHLDDDLSLQTFKENVHESQYHATLKNAHITTFEVCKVISFKADKKAKINAYTQRIKSLIDIAYFEVIKSNTITKKIYLTLLTIIGTTYETKDFKDVTENKLRKTIRFNKQLPTVKDMKGGIKMFHENRTRSNGNNFTQLEPVTIESVAKEFGISEADVKQSMRMYIQNIVKDKKQQKGYAKAVEQVYGVEVDL